MKFSRSSRGIAALAVVLALFAIFFDTLPAAIASGALVVFIAARAVLFIAALFSTAGSIRIQRSISSQLVRQGTPVTVVTEGHVAIPPGFSAAISDLPPPGTVPSSDTIIPEISEERSFRLNYTLYPLTTGELAFEGIRFSLSDPFFSSEIVYRSAQAITPSLVILPSIEYALAERDIYGEKETIGLSVLTSPDVRSFREYLPGDDLRKIDWKLSAKYDTLYIREYMGREERTILLVVDLPDSAIPFSTEAVNRLKEATVSAIVTHMSNMVPFSVLFISGPNLVSFTPFDPDSRWLVAIMNQLKPVPRLHHMYRYRSNPSLVRRFSPLLGLRDPFSQTLYHISTIFLSHRIPTMFESQISRVFHKPPIVSAYLFTLASHDASHIRIISEQAAFRGINLQFNISDEKDANPACLGPILGVPVEVV